MTRYRIVLRRGSARERRNALWGTVIFLWLFVLLIVLRGTGVIP